MTPPPSPATTSTAVSTAVRDTPKVLAGNRQVQAALGGERKSALEQFALGTFVVVPFLALLAAGDLAGRPGMAWRVHAAREARAAAAED